MAELITAADGHRAAFFRVEGTLTALPTARTAAWFTLNSQNVADRVTRLGGVALATGLKLAGAWGDQQVVPRLTWMGLRGMSEDRLVVLSEEYYEQYLQPTLLEVGQELVREARRQGHRIILISDNLESVMRPFVDALRADELVANRLEMRSGRATGRLRDPVIGGHLAGGWARAFAAERSIDLASSCAYGAAAADSMLLNAIGRPCAVNPDWRLRRIARDLDWPVVERR